MISSRQCSQASCRAVLSSRSRSCAAGSRARAPRRLPLPGSQPCPRRPFSPSSRRWRGSSGSKISGSCAVRRRAPRPRRRAAARPSRRRYRRDLDLGRLLTDTEARVRRRAALAVGRVGLPEGVPLLTPLLNDADPEVRQMAAFALGLIGDRSARDPLVTALGRSVAARAGQRLRGAGPHRRSRRGRADRRAAHAARRGAGGNGRGRRRVEARYAGGGVPPRPRSAGPPEGLRRAGRGRARRVGSAESQVVAGGVRARPSRGQARARRRSLTLAGDNTSVHARRLPRRDSAPFAIGRRVPVLLPLLTGSDSGAQVEAIRALGRIGDPAAAQPLLRIAQGGGARRRRCGSKRSRRSAVCGRRA